MTHTSQQYADLAAEAYNNHAIDGLVVLHGISYKVRENMNRQDISAHQIEAELLEAYNAADVTLCEGHLCANVDAKGKAYGATGQYRAVRARPD